MRRLAESPAYLARFRQVLNDRAPQFVASLVQLVSSSSYLAKCDPNTIMAAAITAAALDLPIDKNLGFAHIVPYRDQAQFQMGYKGFIQLAVRTGQYKFLNCCVVHEGELVKHDELSAEVVLDPKGRTSDTVIGYAAYFKLMNGFEHAEYWTAAEVNDHARRYSQAFKQDRETPWKTNFDAMALKTVVKSLLSHWGIMSIEMQRALNHDQGIRANPDSDDVAYPDNTQEVKQPERSGPAEAQEAAGAIDVAAEKVSQRATDPFKDMEMLCKTDGVTYSQVLAFMKEKGLCKDAIVELQQVHDDTLRTVIGTWKTVLGKIKSQKI